MNIIHGDVDLIRIGGVPTFDDVYGTPDLELTRISGVPATAKKQNKKYNNHVRGTWIELGEHSGNAHVITPTKGGIVNFYLDGEELYTEVIGEPAVITHEEHAPLIIPIGIYKKVIEREYDPFTKIIKRVVD